MNLSEEQKADLIEGYLEHTLDRDELKTFEHLIETDEDFKLQFELEKAFYQERELAVEAALEKEIAATNEEHSQPGWRIFVNSVSFKVAASLIFIALAGTLIFGIGQGERVVDSSNIMVFELNQTTMGLAPDLSKPIREIELTVVKKKGYELHYDFNGDKLRVFMQEPIDIGLISIAYEARANMYLLYLKKQAYEIFPGTGDINPLIEFN